MNPLDISAGAVGITAPALHGIYLLLQDLQNIVDAPAAIRTLQADLRSVEQALTPLQAVTKAQWESLGEAVFTQSEAAISACATSCDKFRTQLGRWTRHSENGKLSWQDRAVIGIFKQKQIEFMSQQLQHCSLTLISVASIATLRCCLDKPQSEVAATDVTAKEDEIASTITVTDQELAVLDTSLGQLCLTKLDENDTEIDRVDAITQASATRGALDMSRKLLEDLLSGAGTVVQAGDATREQERVQNSFGGENKGIQIGTNYGSISGITFGKIWFTATAAAAAAAYSSWLVQRPVVLHLKTCYNTEALPELNAAQKPRGRGGFNVMTPRPFSMIRPSPERVAEFDNHQPSSSPQFDYRSPQALKRQHVEAQQQRARKKDRISGGVSGYAVESDSPRGMEKRNSVSLGEESSNGPNLDIRVPPLSAPVAEQPNTALLRPGADSNQHEVSSGDPSDDATQAKPAAMPVSSAPSVSQIQGGQRPGVTFGPQNQGFQIGINYGVIYNGTSAAELARPKPSSHRDATTSSQLSETEKACLQSFWFPGMYVRQRSLEPSAEHTCKWLSERLAYQDWLEDRNQDKYCGLLWLKGNPGTGKSTLMIESYVEAFRNESKSNFITAAFFFNAKGQQLNHSPEGMYRSLLHQLLPKHRDCLQHLSEKGGFEDTPSPETRDWGNTYWKESELRSLFRSMLLTHSTTKRSIIFVDALDECDKDHVRQQVYFWRDLTKAARTAGISLSVCISSRHFPSITVSDCPEIVVEHFNQCDIAIYTEQRLQLAIAAHEPRWQQLRDSIVECSNGVFLWVALVIDQVLKSWDEGNDFGSLLKELKKVPRDLDMLYRTMFEAISPADMPLTRQLFEWSILAVKPLRLHEWHHIMAFIQCPSLSSLAEWKASESYIDSDEQLERRIKSLSKGLIEVRKPRTEEALDMNVDLISTCAGAGSLDTEQGNTRIVQVIHESVREYFMNDRNLFHRSGELHPVAMGHVSIMNTCLGYLGITELDGLVEARIQAQRRAETGFEHQDKEQAELQSRDQGMINGISREGLPQDMEVDVDSSPPRDSMEACSLDICPNLRIIRWMETSHSGYDRMCADPGRASPPSQPHSPNTAAMSEVLESYPALLSYAVFELFTHAQLAQKWEADVSTVLLHFSVERNWARWCALREADLPVFDLSSLIVYANTIGLHTWVERLKHPESPKIPTLAPMREDWGAQLKIPKPFDFGPSDFGPAVGGFRDPKSTLPSPYIDEAIPSTAPPRLSRRGSVASFSSAGSHTGSAVAADNGNGGTPRQSPTPRTKGSPSSSWDLGALQKPRGAKEKPAWFFLCECCPKKPKKFDTAEELRAHEAEKQYECSYCGNRFKNKNEAERHQNSFHARRYSWSCSAISGYDAAFHNSTTHPDEADTCGYCGEEFARSRHGHGLGTGTPSRGIASRYATEQDWKKRIHHLQESHKFKECNLNKKFFRADHFRQHLKHSHAGTSGKWTNMLENACMADENPT